MALLEKLLDEVFAEFGELPGDASQFRKLILTKAAEDPYLESKLERILDLSTSS
ncbi:MAG TPA: hypothetical protein VJ521_09865 [Acidobacteriota bacterium]|nr:hypothetical protein [Acidobacteriota bacterium]